MQSTLEDLFGDLADLSDEEGTRLTEPKPPDPGSTSRPEPQSRHPIPKVGTSIQRGDADNRRRALFLAEPPPPRPPRGRTKAATKRPATPAVHQSRGTPKPAEGPASTQEARPPTGSSGTPRPRVTPTRPPGTSTSGARPARSRPERKPQRAAAPTAAPACAAISATVTVRSTAAPRTAQADRSVPPGPQRTRSPTGKPLPVSLPTGERVLVPHAAVHRNRKYRARTESGRWLLRFDPQGRLKMCRRL